MFMTTKKLTQNEKATIACEYGLTLADIETVIAVESGGIGFDVSTGKIIIQFEPTWFRRKSPYTPSGKWSQNGVERQAAEWVAFNDAFSKNQNAAMESTSVGLMQVMGFHYKLLGFKSVGEMWDFAKVSEANQLRLGVMFIKTNLKMYNALRNHDFRTFAYYYNGSQYEKFNYHTRLLDAFVRFSKK